MIIVCIMIIATATSAALCLHDRAHCARKTVCTARCKLFDRGGCAFEHLRCQVGTFVYLNQQMLEWSARVVDRRVS
jgi:hypothetical protein